ncbi:MAG: hypothetical protein OHK0046_34350 [Anaerolineae bacterium]
MPGYQLSRIFSKRLVTVDGEAIKLTPTEYALLRLLIQHAGKVLTHRGGVGVGAINQTHYLRIYFAQLRQKIEVNPALPKLLSPNRGAVIA